jgi:hypothetical protein
MIKKADPEVVSLFPDFDTGTPKIKDQTFLPVLADFRSKTGSFSAFSLKI